MNTSNNEEQETITLGKEKNQVNNRRNDICKRRNDKDKDKTIGSPEEDHKTQIGN